MRVCVVGSGAREHALVHVLSQTADVVATPGNPGIPNSSSAAPTDIDAELFVIGPEAPLVEGLADQLRAQGKVVFGPGKDGAQLEASKIWMKELLAEAGVPTARWGRFDNDNDAIAFLDSLDNGYVIKTDGLAAGKGVLVTDDRAEAEADIRSKLSGSSFGDAGRRIVIEEKLSGPEFSIFAICNGNDAVVLPPAQDHKRINDGDTGPNTGGVGAYSPVPFVSDLDLAVAVESCILPTMHTLQKRGIDYRGVLYGGFMQTQDGPKMLEYNIRFGDPEAQVVLPRIESDLSALLFKAANGRSLTTPKISKDVCINVVLCSENYPAEPRIGHEITGLDKAESVDGVTIFHAGTKAEDKRLITNGGRVISVVGRGSSITEARDRAYEAVSYIHWPGMQYRTDIAHQALEQGSN